MMNAMSKRNVAIVSAAGLLLALLVAYWPTLVGLVQKWSAVPEYSHGYLVPIIAGIVLWARRDRLNLDQWSPSIWGLLLLGIALAFRHASAYFFYEWFEQLSLVACAPGIVLLLGGWAAMKWAWPACVFLLFMVPLPYGLEIALREPLRDIGTVASTYVMQTIGLPAYAEGKVIVVNDVRIGVAEACSGLRMLMIFFALSTAVAILVDQPLWRRAIILGSAIPIALIANIARITSTGSLHAIGYSDFAESVFHDLAGWLMMVLALILLWMEILVLDRLVIEETEDPDAMAGAFGLGNRRQASSLSPAMIGKQ